MKQLKCFLKEHLLAISLFFLITFLVWYKILNQTFLGEGYFYFESKRSFISPIFGIKVLGSYDNFARAFFDLAVPIFRDNLFLYQLTELLISGALYASLYIVLYKITKQKLLSFSAAILFASNYIGNFEMIADGNYDRFVQRVPNLIPALFSFFFLTLYLNKNKTKYLVISLLLFIFSVFLAHFTTIMLPLFVIYPFTTLLKKKVKFKDFVRLCFIALLFVAINFIQVKLDPFQPSRSFSEFLSGNPNLLTEILYQIPAITMPHETIKYLGQIWPGGPFKNPYLPVVQFLTPTLIIIFVIGGILIYRKQRNLFNLYLSIHIASVLGIILYFYSDDKLTPLKDLAQGRQYYIFEMYMAAILAILIRTLLANSKIYKVITFILLSAFVILNSYFISKDIEALDYKVSALRRYTSYMKTLIPEFTDNTVVLVKSSIHWPNDMLQRIYNPPHWHYESSVEDFKKIVPKNPNDIYVIDYDFGLDPAKEPSADTGKVIDLTKKYRDGKLDLSNW